MNRIELRERLVTAGLERWADELLALSKECIRLNRARADDSMIPLGASKLGGAPDLPEGERWPERDGHPYSFIAQINFAEANPYDPTGLLPSRGMLYVFIDLFALTWWVGGSLVIYRDTPVEQLRRALVPPAILAAIPSDSYLDAFHFPAASVSFERNVSLRSQFSDRLHWNEWTLVEADAYMELEFTLRDQQRPNHQMLGNPESIQYDFSDAPPADWLMILQLGWDKELGWGWGDSGLYSVWLQEDALQKLDFSATLFDFQCH